MKRFFTLLIIISYLTFTPCAFADQVVYNVKTSKYHSPTCESAKRCTVNCIKIDRKEAVKMGGIPCKICKAKH